MEDTVNTNSSVDEPKVELTETVQSVEAAPQVDQIHDDLPQREDESEPFIQAQDEAEEPELNLDTTAQNITGSLASFRERVYSPTTVAVDKPKSNTCVCSKDNCCVPCFKKCYTCCKPVMWKYHPQPAPDSTCLTRLKYALMCPPHGRCAFILFLLVSVTLGFLLVWAMTGEEGMVGGTFFGLYVLFLLCVLAGILVPYIKLPPLLGMLVMGCILGNVPYINVARHIDPGWSSALRKVALAVILTRAGLGLDPKALKRMSCVVIRLAFIPCVTEAVTCMVTSHFILGLDWIWGLMLGFVLAAVSPAVVVPSLLSLSERGYGIDQGIPTLVIAAASIDDVLAISAFSICLGIAFTDTSSIVLTIFKGPLEAIGGVAYGILFGMICWYLPVVTGTTHITLKRSGILLAGGLFALFGSSAAGIDGAGALGCLTLPFVAALRWRKELPIGQTQLVTEVHMGYLWTIFQPLLFGLIGAAVDLTQIELKVIGLGIAILLIGLVLRLVVSFLAVFGTDFTWKERFFIPLAWLPKATVQALIGSIAYDTAIEKNASEQHKTWGMQILTIAVLCILVTAPVGAAAMSISGPRLLQMTKKTDNREFNGVSSDQRVPKDKPNVDQEAGV